MKSHDRGQIDKIWRLSRRGIPGFIILQMRELARQRRQAILTEEKVVKVRPFPFWDGISLVKTISHRSQAKKRLLAKRRA